MEGVALRDFMGAGWKTPSVSALHRDMDLRQLRRHCNGTGTEEAEGWTVTEAAGKLGCMRQTFSRLLNGRTGVSPAMALALERIGWSNAAFWVRRQAHHQPAQVCVSRNRPHDPLRRRCHRSR